MFCLFVFVFSELNSNFRLENGRGSELGRTFQMDCFMTPSLEKPPMNDLMQETNEKPSPLSALLNSSSALETLKDTVLLSLLSFVSDAPTKSKGLCQPGQKQSGSECICMSPEEDCRYEAL